MPIRKVPGGWKWGVSGKTYKTRGEAERQQAAIFASGWHEDARSRLLAHRALSASRKAETAYIHALLRIMGQVHAGVLHVVHREHLGTPAEEHERHDAVGLGDELLRRMLRYVRPSVQMAFDFMATDANKASERGTRLVGVRPRMVPGLAKVLDQARQKNVELITGASQDFLDDVRGTLEEYEGVEPGAGRAAGATEREPRGLAEALQERVGVSRSRAVLIARDQTLKLASNLNQHRQRAAGVERYRWSTSHDERVRPSHADLDGQVFSWEDPPIVDDEEANPGEPIQCRCIALPVLEELEEEVGEETQEPDEEEEFGQAAE